VLPGLMKKTSNMKKFYLVADKVRFIKHLNTFKPFPADRFIQRFKNPPRHQVI
jgi:hypothetical protein